MPASGLTLRVLPDAERVEAAMVEASSLNGFADGTRFCSFAELVAQLARLPKRRPCSPLTSRVLLWSVARSIKPNPMGAFVQDPGFARAASEWILDAKAGNVAPADIEKALISLPEGRRPRAQFLARVFAAYEAALKKLGLADREDQVQGAIEALREDGLPDSLTPFARIELRGLFDFPPRRLTLVMALARACQTAGSILDLQLPAAGAAGCDAAVDPVLATLERDAQDLASLEAGKEDRAEVPLLALGRGLFTEGASLLSLPTERLRLLGAASARAEARALARVARSHVDQGVPPERIALCYRDLGDEVAWLEEALGELGLSARVRRGGPLAASRVGRLCLELPRVVDEGYPAREVALLLESRYARAISRPALDCPERWLSLAAVRDNRLGAEGEKGAYAVRLASLAGRLHKRDPEGAQRVRELADRCSRLFSVLDRVPAQGKALDLLTRWWSCVEGLEVPKAVRQPEPRDAEGTFLGASVLRALAKDQSAAEALRELATELDGALRLSGAGQERWSRRLLHRWLEDAAQDFELVSPGARSGAVSILDVRELAGRSFDVVCVGGLVDGRFPGRDLPHALFPDEDRRAVNRHLGRDAFRVTGGEPGARAPFRLAEDRLLLFLALTAASDAVVLSYARVGPSGAEQIPSPFLEEIQRLTGLVPQMTSQLPVPSLGEVQTETELRQRVSLEAFAPPSLRTGDPEAPAERVLSRFQAEPWLGEAQALVEIDTERLMFFSDPGRAPGPFSGAVEPEDAQAAFAFDARRPLDSSSLDRFGNCAFQGFLTWGLKLREPDEPGEELDVRGRGTFWHAVMEALFPSLARSGLLGQAEVPDAIIDEALEAAIAATEENTHVGHPALWRLSRDKAREMVRRLLATDHRGLPLDGHAPRHTELKFGYPDSPKPWREVVLALSDGQAPVYLRGKIDRVDAGAGGMGIVDYKTGRLRAWELRQELLETGFQLPLYLHALRQSGHAGPVSAAWLSLRDGEAFHLGKLLESGQTLDTLLSVDPAERAALAEAGRKNLANAVGAVVKELRAGHFGARPHDCEYCSFRPVCRISDRRLEEVPNA